ncbi:hypothetical protein VTI74DRAFT_924 [Chaetomium olivicolor]
MEKQLPNLTLIPHHLNSRRLRLHLFHPLPIRPRHHRRRDRHDRRERLVRRIRHGSARPRSPQPTRLHTTRPWRQRSPGKHGLLGRVARRRRAAERGLVSAQGEGAAFADGGGFVVGTIIGVVGVGGERERLLVRTGRGGQGVDAGEAVDARARGGGQADEVGGGVF